MAGTALRRIRLAANLSQRGLVCLILVLPFWYVPRGQANQEAPGHVSQETLHVNAELLERQLGRLLPERPGIADLYFVGAALYARQDVFMKEVKVIADLFKERFDADGRALLLINNRKTVKEIPAASAATLRRALVHVGKTVNPNEDILFLYLTSHGSKNHKLTVDLGSVRLADIDPPILKKILDEAGIKWRVVVVSACYSGGFIPPLKDPYTMIATAADAKHASFGCSDHSDFTYLAKAYFDEELRKDFSFIGAFKRAQRAIRDREVGQGYTPSNPQLFVGEEIRPKLMRIEERLKSTSSSSQHTR
ncbi:MAG: C13 family peptidase [Candidatus Binatia bacterium]